MEYYNIINSAMMDVYREVKQDTEKNPILAIAKLTQLRADIHKWVDDGIFENINNFTIEYFNEQ